MTDKPAPTSPTLLNLRCQAAIKAGEDNDDERMVAAGERARRLAQKAIAEGKAGIVTDGEITVIVEK